MENHTLGQFIPSRDPVLLFNMMKLRIMLDDMRVFFVHGIRVVKQPDATIHRFVNFSDGRVDARRQA